MFTNVIKMLNSFLLEKWSGTTRQCIKIALFLIIFIPNISFATTLYTQSPNTNGGLSTYGTGGYPVSGFYYSEDIDTTVITSASFYLGQFAGLATGPIYGVIYHQVGSVSVQIATSTNNISNANTLPNYTSATLQSFTFSSVVLDPNEVYYIGISNQTSYVYFSVYSPGVSATTTGSSYSHVGISGSPYNGGAYENSLLGGEIIGTLIPPYPIASSIHIDNPNSQTYVSNPIIFSGTYDNIDLYDSIQFQLNYASSTILFPSLPINLINGGPFDWSTSRDLPYTGSYTVKARLIETGTGSTTNWSNEVDFALGSTSTNPYVNAPLPDCQTFDIACYISNALLLVFEPKASAVAPFYAVDDILATKAPFIYGFQTPALFNTLLTSSSTASTTLSFDIPMPGFNTDNKWHIVFMSTAMLDAVTILPWLRFIIGCFMVLTMVDVIYRQFMAIHNNHTK